MQLPWAMINSISTIFTNQSNAFKNYENVIINTENGPVIIDDSATIEPFSVLNGPLFIGKNCLIKSHSTISNCIINHHCKISDLFEYGSHGFPAGQRFWEKNHITADGVFYNEDNGPVFVHKNAIVEPFTVLNGPLFIGKNCLIKSHSTISNSIICLLYTSPSPRDVEESRMPSSA